MNNGIQLIPFLNLALAFIPAGVVVIIFLKWSLDFRESLHAITRMLAQLLLVGYFLAFIFDSDSALIVLGVLTVMVFASSWIALRTIKLERKNLFFKAFFAIFLGGSLTLLLVSQGVLNLNPWYSPRYLIPLAGMIFSQAMNSVSLAAERMRAESGRGLDYEKARGIALRASLIPITNSLFAVGLVSLPGMMTGQILSGISPLIAVRYQIMVMCMVYGASGMASALFLTLIKPQNKEIQT
ncbi:Probable iron export permease protein FetB [hydrothermal vent metagenome]|uniref:Probable iron export permease protein FetB n=1 Tax=hydrothermal vent metagenome TaxID=652676 RepID=A0A3B1CDN7_9ZZZZ